MPTAKPRVRNQFPNELKKTRQAARIEQKELRELCEELARSDPDTYTTISPSTVSVLENGYHKPQPKTAETLAKALNVDVKTLFPLGTDDFVHNPAGISGSDPDRKKGGRPRSK